MPENKGFNPFDYRPFIVREWTLEQFEEDSPVWERAWLMYRMDSSFCFEEMKECVLNDLRYLAVWSSQKGKFDTDVYQEPLRQCPALEDYGCPESVLHFIRQISLIPVEEKKQPDLKPHGEKPDKIERILYRTSDIPGDWWHRFAEFFYTDEGRDMMLSIYRQNIEDVLILDEVVSAKIFNCTSEPDQEAESKAQELLAKYTICRQAQVEEEDLPKFFDFMDENMKYDEKDKKGSLLLLLAAKEEGFWMGDEIPGPKAVLEKYDEYVAMYTSGLLAKYISELKDLVKYKLSQTYRDKTESLKLVLRKKKIRKKKQP